MSDININMLLNNKLYDFCYSYGYQNTIFEGTRLNPQTLDTTLLDVILTTNYDCLVESKVIPYSNSDHSLEISIFNFHSSYFQCSKVMNRCLSNNKLLSLSVCLSSCDFLALDLIDSVDLRILCIKNVILSCLNYVAPIKSINKKNTRAAPWVDKNILNLSKQKNKLYNLAKKNQDVELWLKYKILSNKLRSMSSSKKANYLKTFIEESNTSSQLLWRKLGPYLNPNKKNPILSTIKIDNKCVNSKKDLLFHFSKVFTVSHDDKSLFVHDFPHISESLSFKYKNLDPIRNILLENSAVPFSFAIIHPEAVKIAIRNNISVKEPIEHLLDCINCW